MTVIAATVPLSAGSASTAQSVAVISIPDSPLARDAESAARESLPAEIFNHSLRTFLFAELVSKAHKIDHDVEAVYVASILHDTGLSAAHMSESYRFEVDGANLARDILKKHGVTGQRADVVWDAIALHDSSLARWKGPEVRLVSNGVNARLRRLSRRPRQGRRSFRARRRSANELHPCLPEVRRSRRQEETERDRHLLRHGRRLPDGSRVPPLELRRRRDQRRPVRGLLTNRSAQTPRSRDLPHSVTAARIDLDRGARRRVTLRTT